MTRRRLTEYSHGAGCGCKLAPAALASILQRVPAGSAPDLLLGTGDDAAVWRVDDDRAFVATVDVITPIVDDAVTWGHVAATNAASDVYAMGGRPLFGLNVVCWNAGELGDDLLVEVLTGARDAAGAGDWVIVGGHTVDDPQPKFGVAVVGEVRIDELMTKDGLRPGQALVLTKAIGVGTVATALKAGAAGEDAVAAAVASMQRSNAAAARVAVGAGARGATDVTGFGLLGHLRSLAETAGADVALEVDAVPVLPGARDLIAAGHVPGGTRRNLRWVNELVDRGGAGDDTMALLADPQTSGGLLFGVDPDRAGQAVAALQAEGHPAAVVGAALAPGTGRIRLR